MAHLEGVFCWQFIGVRALERQKLVHCCGDGAVAKRLEREDREGLLHRQKEPTGVNPNPFCLTRNRGEP